MHSAACSLRDAPITFQSGLNFAAPANWFRRDAAPLATAHPCGCEPRQRVAGCASKKLIKLTDTTFGCISLTLRRRVMTGDGAASSRCGYGPALVAQLNPPACRTTQHGGLRLAPSLVERPRMWSANPPYRAHCEDPSAPRNDGHCYAAVLSCSTTACGVLRNPMARRL